MVGDQDQGPAENRKENIPGKEEISMIKKEPSKNLFCGLHKTLKHVLFLLSQEQGELNYAKIHYTKSLLYASIERINTKIETLSSVQRRLRELFVIVTSLSDPVFYEKEAGKHIVGELLSKHSEILMWDERNQHDPKD